MAGTDVIDGATSATSATHTATTEKQNIQVEGLGATGFTGDQPRVVISVDTSGGSDYSHVQTIYEDSAEVFHVKTGGVLNIELKDPTASTNCTVNVLE